VALHCLAVGVHSAQALVLVRQIVQIWVFCVQVPWLLQVPANWSVVDVRQLAVPHGVVVLADVQSGLDPLQVALQGAVPLQDFPVRGNVVLVHLPWVAAHVVQVPVQPLSQQYPSIQNSDEHSDLSEQESPCFFKVAHVDPAQYFPVPQEVPVQLPEQSLPSARQRLLSHVILLCSGQ
jgi:hypothetical protein